MSDLKQQPFAGAQYDAPEAPVQEKATENTKEPVMSVTDMWQQGNVAFNGKFKMNGLFMQPIKRLAPVGGIVTVDCTTANRFSLLLTANTTIYLRPPTSDAHYTIFIKEDAVGGWTVTWGINGTGQPIVKTISGGAMGSDTAAGHIEIHQLEYLADFGFFVVTTIPLAAY